MALKPTERWHAPDDYWYDGHHQWIADGEDTATLRVGVTDYTQDTAGEILYVSLPEPGASVKEGEPFGSIESGKWVGQLYAPCDGTVVAINTALQAEPQLLNQDPYQKGWLIELHPATPKSFSKWLTPPSYRALLATLDDGYHD